MPTTYSHKRICKRPWQHQLAAILIREGKSLQYALERAGWGRAAESGLKTIMKSGPLVRELAARGIPIERLRYEHRWQCPDDDCAKWNWQDGACAHCKRKFPSRKVYYNERREQPRGRMMRTPEVLRDMHQQLSAKSE